MRRLVLWDIDGTLIQGGPTAAIVFDGALERALGVAPSGRVTMSGKTDPQIVREYLTLMDIDEADHHVPLVLKHLETELAGAADALARGGRVLPGVEAVLRRLDGTEGVLQSVLTGNIAPNAVVKLAAFDLKRWLDLEVGAYGSDDADRRALVPIAVGRAKDMRGASFEADEVWVIGDTANDLACARAGQARCLLVATGRSSLAELSRLGADAVVEDLGAVDDIVALLTSDRV